MQEQGSGNCSMATKERTHVNNAGDHYAVNEDGHITFFRFRDNHASFSFAYGEDGTVEAISSSMGWTWTKTRSEEFSGWVIRNYFDRWQVKEEECGLVYVDATGIKTTGKNPEMMGLPETSH